MKLIEIRSTYYDYSGISSSVTRQIAFAGLAIIWIFKSETSIEVFIDKGLAMPAMFFVLCLSFDLLHYIVSSLIWGICHRISESKHDENDEFKVNSALNWPGLFFFWLKHASVIVGYCLLFKFIITNIKFY